MRVTELVPILAEAIARSGVPLSDDHRRMVSVLEAMPDYAARRALDDWEAAFPPRPRPIDPNDPGSLLEAVFDLGTHNLYTRFDAPGTLREYRDLQSLFRDAGIATPNVDAIEDW